MPCAEAAVAPKARSPTSAAKVARTRCAVIFHPSTMVDTAVHHTPDRPPPPLRRAREQARRISAVHSYTGPPKFGFEVARGREDWRDGRGRTAAMPALAI